MPYKTPEHPDSLDSAAYVEAAWTGLLQSARDAQWDYHRWQVPLIEAILRYPRLRALRPVTSHVTLCLSETTHHPYAPYRLPAAEPVAEGWFRVRRYKPRTRGFWLWKRVEYLETEVVGEGDAEAAAELMDALLPADCGPASGAVPAG